MIKNKLILTCDIGASKTNLAIVSESSGPLNPLSEATLRSADYSDAIMLIRDFLSQESIVPYRACLGVAGPVIDNQSTTTNLPWFLDGAVIAKATGIEEVILVNDLKATAASITLLNSEDLFSLNEGKPSLHGNIAVISPGTGLGEGFLIWDDDKGTYIPHASEGGHSDFAPVTETETKLLEYLREKIGHVSFESVCSGRGLPNIYDFLKRSKHYDEPEWLKELLDNSDDHGRVIIESALQDDRHCPICDETVKIFVSILGSEAGNHALKVMATGGIYIGGGIPARITSILDSSTFLKGFLNKGNISGLLANIPVKVILDQKAPLKGAAMIALNKV